MSKNEKYIKVHDVMKKLNYLFKTYGVSPRTKELTWDAINKIPYVVKGELETTLDVQEVRHGEWVYDMFEIPHCSECGVIPNHISKYCPNCGARMEE